jgi:AraC-like DNA-binding protein
MVSVSCVVVLERENMQKILTALPGLALRQSVKHYLQRECDTTDVGMTESVPARSQNILEFQFRSRYAVEYLESNKMEAGCRIAIVGPQTRQLFRLGVTGPMEEFVVVFTPTGLFELFGCELNQFVDSAHEADDVVGTPMRALWQRLGDVNQFSKRIEIVEEFLAPRICNARPSIRKVVTYINGCSGAVQISDLARKTGMSVRNMERRFRTQVGLPPKAYARIVRCEQALLMKAANPEWSWSRIAYELNYFDQMHMVHDFASLSGKTPVESFSKTAYGLSLSPQAWISFSTGPS